MLNSVATHCPDLKHQHFADHIIAERGVRYGRVVMIPTATGGRKLARKRPHRHD